ncbi:Bifunctional protein HldE [Thalassocella blandensis]|nr:Bifunctional protein HldE [Thalassocella blandensis]
MSSQLPDFNRANILVIGDVMLDRYWSGSTTRISPEAPVPVVKVGDIENRLGGAANVAQNLAALGCKVSLSGIIGQDEAAEIIKTLLAKSNIEDLLAEDSNNPTITKLRVMSRHQQLLRLDFEEKLHNTNKNKLLDTIKHSIDQFDAVIISDYAKGTIADAQPIIQICRTLKKPVFVDPKGTDFSHYKNANAITPNLSELQAIVGEQESLETLFVHTERLCKQLNLEAILVTLSEKGMALIQQNKPALHIPTLAKDVFDVTGAGDTVIATFTACVAAGNDLPSAMNLSNVAAGVVVGKLGTSTVNAKELQMALLQQDQFIDKGAISLSKLVQQIEICRHKGEKIVFTNGCFDILHAGHVRYLKQAAELGDRLVVGLNSDASIKRLKGEERPVVSLDERLEVLSSLNCVDWVIPFEQDTPATLIDAIIPDFLVKGGDYTIENIVGYETVTQHGGKVLTLPFVPGCSTSSIIEKIKQL